MGLDMYLTKKTYVKNWDHQKPEERYEITISKGGKECKDIKGKRIMYIEEEVCYWRKANEIHNWFVKNVQKGQDDCGVYYVPTEKLQELYDLICLALDKRKNAPNLLPTQGGFFFGNTDYDEWYWKDLERTKKVFKSLLKEFRGADFYYHSSW